MNCQYHENNHNDTQQNETKQNEIHQNNIHQNDIHQNDSHNLFIECCYFAYFAYILILHRWCWELPIFLVKL